MDARCPGFRSRLTLITILLAHEMGHYLTCRYYGIDASLPYFLPAPTLDRHPRRFHSHSLADSLAYVNCSMLGLPDPLPASCLSFRRWRSGWPTRRSFPVSRARVISYSAHRSCSGCLNWQFFRVTPPQDIFLHPIGRAAWVGLFATALNLMPIGQLDGGHILYSFVGDRHRTLTNLFIVALHTARIFFFMELVFLGIAIVCSWDVSTQDLRSCAARIGTRPTGGSRAGDFHRCFSVRTPVDAG